MLPGARQPAVGKPGQPIRAFAGKVAIVTGGARGIGLALATALHARGAALALVDLSPDVTATAAAFARGPQVTAHVADVADRARVAALVAEVVAAHGGVDVLVNNAGVSLAGRFDETSLADFDWVMAVNFGGAVNATHAFLPLLRARPEAHVLNVCSSFAWLGTAGKSGYAASKAALRAFTEALRAELAGTAVGVTLLFPGPVATEIVRGGRAASIAQRDAEARFLDSRAVSAERVARRALAGIERNAARVVVSLDYRALDALVRFSPALAQAIAARAARRLPF